MTKKTPYWFRLRRCKRCGGEFEPQREKQVYCSTKCRVGDAVQRFRDAAPPDEGAIEAITDPAPVPSPLRSDYSDPAPAAPSPRAPSSLLGSNPDGSTPGALQGDDYQLEYYPDGYPKLPEFLRRASP